MSLINQYQINISKQVEDALLEDLGGHISVHNDITAMLINADVRMSAKIITRENCVLCGEAWVNEVFAQIDKDCQLDWRYKDGDELKANDTILYIQGNARSILTAERTALNFLQTLSGTATTTATYVKFLTNTNTRLLDTRKTLPGLRQAQKYAVACAQGMNHRMGLYDAFLIKENHIKACGSIKNAVSKAQHMYPDLPIEVEVENLQELDEAINSGVNTIMLDNFDTKLIEEAVVINAGRCKLEVSGNITFDRLQELATTGVDYISSGALTKHVTAIDLSLITIS
ncbi:carboxylating nicotinate-nucleotide diphosphorylase [Glaciecola sp. 33A]|jgi:nicotinate-nucleotide pyrophosphorylase (carboxylating)|uniref:carboxylating nicotinate-nucleotide diphosphorylase n=1 Tax=Glaciecola sp. 33A TaxID=2057807 RepID=UPI000C32A4C4|nr:carboxylating nicotinate-nucleotide diphosphorylase [Glaciecola sp. 33A]PKI01059.1 nicotinate-nucleotide diphosphorylase (carboxylating) [Glaciecola sp. 33A]